MLIVPDYPVNNNLYTTTCHTIMISLYTWTQYYLGQIPHLHLKDHRNSTFRQGCHNRHFLKSFYAYYWPSNHILFSKTSYHSNFSPCFVSNIHRWVLLISLESYLIFLSIHYISSLYTWLVNRWEILWGAREKQ